MQAREVRLLNIKFHSFAPPCLSTQSCLRLVLQPFSFVFPATTPPQLRLSLLCRTSLRAIVKPYFRKEVRPWATFTTSPSKRRKLSPSSETLEDTAVDTTSLSSPPQLVISDRQPTTSSPSPPRFLPSHLVAEGARTARSPTPEPPLNNTGANSPSAAYSGLNLDSDGSAYGSGQEANTRRRRRSIPQSVLGDRTGAQKLLRTSSPAKRRASAMAGGGVSHDDVDMGGVDDADTNATAIPSIEVADASGTTRRESVGHGSQHKREKSVEMMLHDGDKNAYETPQSGVSSAGEAPTVVDIPSIDDQIAQVKELATTDSGKEGQKGYIISNKWLSRVLYRGLKDGGKDREKYGKDAGEGDIGPVDNSALLDMITDPTSTAFKDEVGDPFVPLRPGLQLGEDFEILPEKAWNLVISWYGMARGSPVITRYCHNTSTSETVDNLQYELFPPIFTILKLPDRSGGMSHKDLKEQDAAPVKILASRHERYVEFLRRAKTEVGIEMKVRVRVWRILGGLKGSSPSGVMTPAQSRASSPAPGAIIPVDPGNKLVLDVNTFIGLQRGSEREDLDTKDETANSKYNGNKDIDLVGLRQDSVLVLEEQIQGAGGGEYVSDGAASAARSNGVPITVTRSGAISSLKPNTSSRGASPAPSGGMMTRGRQTKVGKMKGTCGLSNLGNTCYMNSALQCVKSVEELSMYFLENRYTQELNPSNPLGTGGQVAKSYANLLHEMFHNSNQSFPPRNFKNVIGKAAPAFSGYGQQDSQEFLLFLLDGLHEDLNRILQKPQTEKPDSTDEMVDDPVALRKLADESWDIYKQRNDSVVADIFAGMYKSTLTCPVCHKVSIIFDPFNNLTLQLPIESPFQRRLIYFPFRDRPIHIEVDIDKNSSFFALKEHIAAKFPGTDPKRLVVAESYKSRFYKFFDDNNALGEETLAETDVVGIWEIEEQPTNFPPPKQTIKRSKGYYNDDVEVPDMASPIADKILVSIFNRRPSIGGTRYGSSGKQLFGSAGFIVLTREEARDHDAILKKVLAYVATLTTRDFLQEEEEGYGSATADSDTILTNAEDAEMEPKVHAESLESEDDMVDISTKGQADQDSSDPSEPKNSKATNKKPLPKMLRPDGEISDAVRGLFEMKIISTNNEMVPIGWSSFQNESTVFPPLADRCTEHQLPHLQTKEKPMETITNIINNQGDPVSSDEDVVEDPPQIYQNPIEGSDSDDGLPAVQQIQPARSSGSRKKLTTYSKKGKQPFMRGGGDGVDESMMDDTEGFLIRLGEGLLLDWSADASENLFLSPQLNSDDGMRGLNTWEQVQTLPDPTLAIKKQFHNNRKKNGISLGECLDEFGKPEILSEDDAWYCPRCKKHRRASKKFELWKAPDILVIHLKRFRFQGRFRDKIEVKVDFPLEGLDLSSRLVVPDGDKSSLYDLIAVDNHYGGLGGGHYTAYAQNFMDKNWYEYNDSVVSKRTHPQNQVVSSAAYLLFYRRRSDTPLGGPFFEEMLAASNTRDPSEPLSDSRAHSPAGEGRRLDGPSSRNGSSSALRGVGAAHQAEGGGAAVAAGSSGLAKMKGVADDDDDLPAYSRIDPQHHQQSTLEEIDMDDDEGVGDLGDDNDNAHRPSFNLLDQPVWSFDNVNTPDDDDGANIGGGAFATGHDDQREGEGEGDNASNRVQSTAGSDRENRMADFDDDEDDGLGGSQGRGGDMMGGYGTPPGDARREEVPWEGFADEGEGEGEVAEIRHGGGEDEVDELA